MEEFTATTDQTTEHESNYEPQQGELVIGTLRSIDEKGQPVVSFQLNQCHSDVTALATTPITAQHLGRQVGLLFAQNSDKTPVIVGVIHNPLHSILDNIEVVDSEQDKTLFEPKPLQEKMLGNSDAIIDGNRVVIEGKDEVVLKCGESSITLNKNGKISIRGKYLLNRSSGVNRIMGGSVQVN